MNKDFLELSVELREPGVFLWVLMETDAHGLPVRLLRRAEYACSSYESAMAAGTRVLSAVQSDELLKLKAPEPEPKPSFWNMNVMGLVLGQNWASWGRSLV